MKNRTWKVNIVKLSNQSPHKFYIEIARIHIAEIHSGFLPLLGDEFLARLYFEMSQVSTAGLWAAEENEKVLGFILGVTNIRKSYIDVFKRAWFPFIKMGVRFFLKKDFLVKLPTIIMYPFHQHAEGYSDISNPEQPSAELLSIAVLSSAKGRGIGTLLVQKFEQTLSESGLSRSYFVTTNSEDPNSNAFYRKLGFLECGKQKHNDLVLQVYTKPVIPQQFSS
jgi:ribosomal protein S18 acetylase RimI-like enzyme